MSAPSPKAEYPVAPGPKRRRRQGLRWKVIAAMVAMALGAIVAMFLGPTFRTVETHASESTLADTSLEPVPPEEANSVLVTSEPSGAEVVHRGAVIGNTPTRVRRAAWEELYLVRSPGLEPRLVRVTQETADTVHLTLKPKESGR